MNHKRDISVAASHPIDTVLSRLDGVCRTGPDKWLCRCPAHDDRSPSLSIRSVDDRVLVHCFGGCGVDDVLSAVGLDISDLFPRRHGRDHDPLAPRAKRPRFSGAELLPLVVTEAVILALAFREVVGGGVLSDADLARAEMAEHAVLGAWVEVRS